VNGICEDSPALRHHTRRAGRDPRRWNEACDYAINPLLLDAGLKLPEGVLVDNRFRGLSAEEIYNRLTSERKAPAAPDGEEHSESGGQGCGEAEAVGLTSPFGEVIPMQAA
jgi:predicted metal-dependent peptidase